MTGKRAENVLFAGGCLWKGSAPIKDWADLKGKSGTVNKGTPYETLSKAKGAEHGFTEVYDTQPDATQAVLSGRGYSTLGGNTTTSTLPQRPCGSAARIRTGRGGWSSGLGLLTPADVHHGLAEQRVVTRASVLATAYAAHPERFPAGPPHPPAPPVEVWSNPPIRAGLPQTASAPHRRAVAQAAAFA